MKAVIIFLTLCASIHAATLGDALRHLAPTADATRDFVVIKDDQGERIVFWNTAKLGAQPNQAQIDQAKLDFDSARAADATEDSNERTLLQAARAKLLNNQDLTNAELRAVLRALIRREIRRQ